MYPHRRRLRVVGVTEAVGEDEAKESWLGVPPMAISEAAADSGAEMSLFTSSLLRRDTMEGRGSDTMFLGSPEPIRRRVGGGGLAHNLESYRVKDWFDGISLSWGLNLHVQLLNHSTPCWS